ncbi:MAG TPA: PilN domain-containing protein [Rhodanobacteraceae bacterium]|nr:PilN domain-containing protein [Rhodanobacteraceae bacterium]
MAMTVAKSLERAKLAWRRSPAPAFLRWWGGELTAMLPTRLREWVRRGPEVLWLTADGIRVTVRRARTGTTLANMSVKLPRNVQREEFARVCSGIDPADRRLLLIVPAADVLVRRLVLPAAAAADPRRVAGYEIDRQTPFQLDQVYYDVRVSGDPAPAGQVALDLYVAPRAGLDPVLERFALIGARPDAVDVQGADGILAGIDLLPAARRPRRTYKHRRANWVLAAVCVLLAVLVLSQWLDNRRQALAKMETDVETMRAKASQSEQLRGQLSGALAASKFLVQRKSDNPSALVVLDDLTQRLPSTAWLDSLTLDDSGGLDIKGEADKAAALVDKLASSGILQEPKLQGVIQPDPATGKERFELVARVRPHGASDAR